jgi:hypothetical protein
VAIATGDRPLTGVMHVLSMLRGRAAQPDLERRLPTPFIGLMDGVRIASLASSRIYRRRRAGFRFGSTREPVGRRVRYLIKSYVFGS